MTTSIYDLIAKAQQDKLAAEHRRQQRYAETLRILQQDLAQLFPLCDMLNIDPSLAMPADDSFPDGGNLTIIADGEIFLMDTRVWTNVRMIADHAPVRTAKFEIRIGQHMVPVKNITSLTTTQTPWTDLIGHAAATAQADVYQTTTRRLRMLADQLLSTTPRWAREEDDPWFNSGDHIRRNGHLIGLTEDDYSKMLLNARERHNIRQAEQRQEATDNATLAAYEQTMLDHWTDHTAIAESNAQITRDIQALMDNLTYPVAILTYAYKASPEPGDEDEPQPATEDIFVVRDADYWELPFSWADPTFPFTVLSGRINPKKATAYFAHPISLKVIEAHPTDSAVPRSRFTCHGQSLWAPFPMTEAANDLHEQWMDRLQPLPDEPPQPQGISQWRIDEAKTSAHQRIAARKATQE